MSQAERNIRETLEEIIEKEIRPVLSSHMGGAFLSDYEDGIAYIRFTGSCRGCYAAEDTMENTVRPVLMERVPQLRDVVLDTSVDQELLDMARSLMKRGKDGDGK
ncbi:MAG: NifU family protein [Emergencia sp.]